MTKKSFPERVDLFTSSRDLEDSMLKQFPGVIKGDQVSKPRIGKERAFGFYKIDGQKLKEFLTYYDSFPYKVIDSETKELIDERKL